MTETDPRRVPQPTEDQLDTSAASGPDRVTVEDAGAREHLGALSTQDTDWLARASRTPRPHRSASQLAEFERCGVLYKMRRINMVSFGPTSPMVRGLALHHAVALNYDQKIETRRDLALDVVLDAAATRARDLMHADQPLHLTRGERQVGRAAVRDSVVDQVVRMSKRYHLERAPHVQPVLVEHRVTMTSRESFDVVVVLDLATDEDEVWDLKSREARPPRGGEEHTSPQLTLQWAAYSQVMGKPPRSVGLEFVHAPKNPAAHARLERLASTRTRADVDDVTRRLREADAAIRRGDFRPANPETDWWCSEKWCVAWDVCPFVAGLRGRGKGGAA